MSLCGDDGCRCVGGKCGSVMSMRLPCSEGVVGPCSEPARAPCCAAAAAAAAAATAASSKAVPPGGSGGRLPAWCKVVAGGKRRLRAVCSGGTTSTLWCRTAALWSALVDAAADDDALVAAAAAANSNAEAAASLLAALSVRLAAAKGDSRLPEDARAGASQTDCTCCCSAGCSSTCCCCCCCWYAGLPGSHSGQGPVLTLPPSTPAFPGSASAARRRRRRRTSIQAAQASAATPAAAPTAMPAIAPADSPPPVSCRRYSTPCRAASRASGALSGESGGAASHADAPRRMIARCLPAACPVLKYMLQGVFRAAGHVPGARHIPSCRALLTVGLKRIFEGSVACLNMPTLGAVVNRPPEQARGGGKGGGAPRVTVAAWGVGQSARTGTQRPQRPAAQPRGAADWQLQALPSAAQVTSALTRLQHEANTLVVCFAVLHKGLHGTREHALLQLRPASREAAAAMAAAEVRDIQSGPAARSSSGGGSAACAQRACTRLPTTATLLTARILSSCSGLQGRGHGDGKNAACSASVLSLSPPSLPHAPRLRCTPPCPTAAGARSAMFCRRCHLTYRK